MADGVTITCPKCGKEFEEPAARLRASDKASVTCPGCGQELQLEGGASAVEEARAEIERQLAERLAKFNR